MDAFEQIVGELLEEEQFWVRNSVKVNLTRADKSQLENPSMPRPEIDLIAFDARASILYLLEVKSFIDSQGVRLEDLHPSSTLPPQGRYKMLTSSRYQEVLMQRLREEWESRGLIDAQTKIKFGLIAGNVHGDAAQLRTYADDTGWFFWGPKDIEERIQRLAEKGYENKQITLVAKILKRGYARALE